MSLFLDANIPMYAVGAEDRYKQPCLAIMRATADGRLDCVSSSEVVQEIMHRWWAIGRRARGLIVAQEFLDALPQGILPVGRADISEALVVAGTHLTLQSRVCVHVGTMRVNGIVEIISADRVFDQVQGITRHDPVAFAARLAP